MSGERQQTLGLRREGGLELIKRWVLQMSSVAWTD